MTNRALNGCLGHLSRRLARINRSSVELLKGDSGVLSALETSACPGGTAMLHRGLSIHPISRIT